MSSSDRNLRAATPSSDTPSYPNLSSGDSSHARVTPSTEDAEEERDDLGDAAGQEAMARQFAAWAQANPAVATAAMAGLLRPIPSATPTPAPPPSATLRRHSTVNGSVSKRQKFPHPPLFKGDRNAWIPFRNKMTTKLRNDSELYPSAEQRLDYWVSRLGDGPCRELQPFYNEHGELRMKSETELIDLLNLLYINSNQKNDELAEYDQLRMKHTDRFIDFFVVFWRLANSTGFISPVSSVSMPIIQHELLRRLPRRLRDHQVYVNIKFPTIEAFRDYYVQLDNYWHQTN